MQNVVLSTRNIDDLVSDIANEVIRKIGNISFIEKPQPQSEKLLTIQEAAEFLNLSVATLYTKVSRNELPFMKKGKRLYFSDKELMRYIKEGKRKSNDELEAEAADYLIKKGGRNA